MHIHLWVGGDLSFSSHMFFCFVIHLCVGINSKVLLSTIRTMGRIKNTWILAEWTHRRKPTEAQRLNINGRISPVVDGSFQARIELRPSVLESCWLWRVDCIPPFIRLFSLNSCLNVCSSSPGCASWPPFFFRIDRCLVHELSHFLWRSLKHWWYSSQA